MKKAVSVRRGAGRRSDRTGSQSYDSSPLNPIRAKRDRSDEDGEDESEIFRRRAEWWRLYHGDPSGVVSGKLRVQAIAHAEKLAAGGLDNPDPGGARPKSGFELIQQRGKGRSIKTNGTRGQNPRPRSSFGFASDAIEVRGPVSLDGVVVKIALDAERLRNVEPATLRVFCFDATSGEWQLVPRSGARAEAGYAWAHLQRPGLYIAVGLPAGANALVTVLTIRALMPRLRAATDEAARRRVLELIGELLSPGPAGRTEAADAVAALDMAGLDVGARGLPEFDIFDDIYPPMSPPWGKNLGKEIIERIRWNNITVDVDGVILFQDWCSVGPRNVSGRIKSLAIHPVEGNGVLAGAADGGVWLTQDGGGTWFPLMGQELSMAIGAVARSGANLSVIYAATGEDTPGWGPSFPGVGVYKSIDGGNSWTLCAPISSDRCTRVLIHPANANIVYVAGDGGLHKSTDGGGSWTNLRNDHVSDAVMDPAYPDTIYAAVWDSGIFRTRDGGVTWADFNDGLPTGIGADWIKLAASEPGGDGSVTLVAKMGKDSGQLFTCRVHVPPVIQPRARRHPPFPPVWIDFNTPWQMLPGTHEPADYNEWTDLVAIDPSRHNVIIAGGIGLQRSTDGGQTFSKVTGTHSDHHAVVFARSNNDLCYMACDGGVYRSVDDGASWTLRSSGLIATQVYSIGVSQTDPFLLGGATQDQGIIKTNGPADWTDTGAGNEGGFFIVDPLNSGNVYVTPSSDNLRRSTDGGTTWQTILTGITQIGTPPHAVTVNHLAICPTDSNLLLCVGGNEVFRSTDQGNSWTSVLTFPSGGVAMRVAWERQNTCYAANDAGLVFRSQQQGAANTWSEPYTDVNKPPSGNITALEARFVTWDVVAQSGEATQLSERRVRPAVRADSIIVFPFRMDLVYIAYSWGGRVYKSTDGGAHWSNASGSSTGALPNIPINALVIDNHLSDTVYIATDIGMFRTRDGGANWEPFNDSLPRVVVSGLALRAKNNTLYASTMGRGAYQRALS
jgi:photosystem II stability/assembly factor-like uncharacterized protein